MAEYVVDLYSEHDGVKCEPVVRCRDCESAQEHYESLDVWWCEYLRMYVNSSDFCCWGKRRADD